MKRNPKGLFLESCSSNTVVELESQKKLFCRIFFKRLWKRDKKTATRISRSRLSQMNEKRRMRIHVRFGFRITVSWLRLFAFVGEDH
jgi:hypothetical protein